ncbi:MAG: response regulator [Anaerolineae bacterium]|nr:response regulator [Anaerolineae bacterium]MBN8620756.1 response regulator [Anaerolineae bacterium]
MNNGTQTINGASVLVIEDNTKLLSSISFLLEVAGLHAIPAASSDEVSYALSRQTPDLILCDADMISADAYSLLRRIHADRRYSHVPFIVMSASYELHDLMYALDLGASDFLPKPFDAYDLMDSIREALLPVVAYRAAG